LQSQQQKSSLQRQEKTQTRTQFVNRNRIDSSNKILSDTIPIPNAGREETISDGKATHEEEEEETETETETEEYEKEEYEKEEKEGKKRERGD